MYRKFFKRLFDIVLSFFGLLFLGFPMIIVAIIIKCDSKGPAIFSVNRVGKNKKPFKIYKFRTMYIDTPKDCAPRFLDSDKYITKVGKVLRKLSIDELPQMINILKGDMSIIGPRPCGFSEQDLMDERDKYGANEVSPGLTGWAQINGRDELAANVPLKAKYDGDYCNNITFINDCKIFLGTIAVVLKREGVVEGAAAIKVKNPVNVEDNNIEEVTTETNVEEVTMEPVEESNKED